MINSEEKRFVGRLRAITFREAKESDTAFIKRQWVAQQIGRSKEFVQQQLEERSSWLQDGHEGIGIGDGVLNQHEKRIIQMATNKHYQSCRKWS